MLPLHLFIEDFMGHRSTDIDCTLFNSVLIVGKSKNDERISNGAGKSTIFKAIEYVLFGEYETKSIDKLVRNGCDKAKVIFDFSLGNGQVFRVQRTRNRKSNKSDLRLWEQQGDVWKDISQKTPTEMENELAKLIKISYQAFRNSVLFAQSDVEGLSSTKSPEKRKLILKEALNLAIYGKFEKIAKEKISELSKKIIAHKALLNALGVPSEDISILQSKLQEAKTLSTMNAQQQKLVMQTIADKKAAVAELQKIISSEMVETQKKLKEIGANSRQQEKTVNNSTKMVEEKERLLLALRFKYDAKLELLKTLEEQYRSLKNLSLRSIQEIQKDLESVSANEYNGKLYVLSLENKLKDLQKPFPNGGECPQCRQTVGHDHRTSCLAKISTDTEAVFAELSQKRKILDSVKHKKTKLEQELSEANLHSLEINTCQQKIENKKIEIQKESEYLKEMEDMTTYLKTENIVHISTLQELRQKQKDLEQILQGIDIDAIGLKIDSINMELSDSEARLKKLTDNLSSLNTQIGVFSEKISAREKDQIKLGELVLDLKSLEKEYQIKQIVAQGFGSGGIPTVIIYTILDDLQIEANKLLNDLRPGLELQFAVTKNKADGQQEDTLDISYRLDGMELDSELLSGGQKLLIALSLRIGLSLVIQHRLGIDIKFLELDEVDQGLDEAGVEAFVTVIKKLQEKLKVFIITHNREIKDKFSHAILVEHDKINGSTARVVNTW